MVQALVEIESTFIQMAAVVLNFQCDVTVSTTFNYGGNGVVSVKQRRISNIHQFCQTENGIN